MSKMARGAEEEEAAAMGTGTRLFMVKEQQSMVHGEVWRGAQVRPQDR